MLVEVKYNSGSFVLKIDDKFGEPVSENLPFKTVLNVWKEEVYFETPLTLDKELTPVTLVKPGKLYYWPPGRGFCVFYGISQPYSEVYEIGEYVGVLFDLRSIEDGEEAQVSNHKPAEEFADIAERLRKLGYLCATPFYDEEKMVTASKTVNGVRIGFNIYVEDYGYHVECEPSNSFPVLLATLKLKQAVTQMSDTVRLDLNEDGWVTLTAFVKDLSDLGETIMNLERVYLKVLKILSAEAGRT